MGRGETAVVLHSCTSKDVKLHKGIELLGSKGQVGKEGGAMRGKYKCIHALSITYHLFLSSMI